MHVYVGGAYKQCYYTYVSGQEVILLYIIAMHPALHGWLLKTYRRTIIPKFSENENWNCV